MWSLRSLLSAKLMPPATLRRSYSSFKDLSLAVFSYIECFYNAKRPHASLGYLTPDEAEARFP
ncbi:IS3 family transposase [Christensenella intestinihominis]|uniref:IS3 family transposase n=1 Tax=Christensenella intestinihominis TaxID=1851429 RepID=UPI0011CA2658|nr:IS3 family transposase [Christensenella intestinihominis]